MAEKVTYAIECTTCNEVVKDEDGTPQIYIGQSGRTIHSRMKEHLSGIRRGKLDCPLWKHQLESHDGSKDHTRSSMRTLERFRNNVPKLLHESYQIMEHRKTHKLMNSKAEYSRNKLVRYTVYTENH